ncbi:hypothetical protein ABK040_007608 [Willaertia magna]
MKSNNLNHNNNNNNKVAISSPTTTTTTSPTSIVKSTTPSTTIKTRVSSPTLISPRARSKSSTTTMLSSIKNNNYKTNHRPSLSPKVNTTNTSNNNTSNLNKPISSPQSKRNTTSPRTINNSSSSNRTNSPLLNNSKRTTSSPFNKSTNNNTTTIINNTTPKKTTTTPLSNNNKSKNNNNTSISPIKLTSPGKIIRPTISTPTKNNIPILSPTNSTSNLSVHSNLSSTSSILSNLSSNSPIHFRSNCSSPPIKVITTKNGRSIATSPRLQSPNHSILSNNNTSILSNSSKINDDNYINNKLKEMKDKSINSPNKRNNRYQSPPSLVNKLKINTYEDLQCNTFSTKKVIESTERLHKKQFLQEDALVTGDMKKYISVVQNLQNDKESKRYALDQIKAMDKAVITNGDNNSIYRFKSPNKLTEKVSTKYLNIEKPKITPKQEMEERKLQFQSKLIKQ